MINTKLWKAKFHCSNKTIYQQEANLFFWVCCGCSYHSSAEHSGGHPVCAPTLVYEYEYKQLQSIGWEDCMCDHFQLSCHVGSCTPHLRGLIFWVCLNWSNDQLYKYNATVMDRWLTHKSETSPGCRAPHSNCGSCSDSSSSTALFLVTFSGTGSWRHRHSLFSCHITIWLLTGYLFIITIII